LSPAGIGAFIGIVYGALLLGWALALPLSRRLSAGQAPAVEPPRDGAPAARSRRAVLAGAGTLLVFLVNILTLGMFVCAAVWPPIAAAVDRMRIRPAPGLQLLGALLFLLDGVWGLLVLVYHPGYTPFSLRRDSKILPATRGPYALVRHPRYASEAALNLILFLLTGMWIPLLGTIGWGALHLQAEIEEQYLLRAAPEAYGRYRASTGRFLPRRIFRTGS
jgi:protein-S-isoprenylcysteine O-methyltransferase Ste14